MKRILVFLLSAMMVLSLASCDKGADNNNSASNTGSNNSKSEEVVKTDVTPQKLLDELKKALGDGYLCDEDIPKDNLENYWGLDLSKIDEYIAQDSSLSFMYNDTFIALKVKDGYADEAVKKLNEGFSTLGSYAWLYNVEIQKMQGARLYRNGNFIALMNLGADGGEEEDTEVLAKLADEEYKKIDDVWKGLFGSVPVNEIVIPEKVENGGFNGEDYSEDDMPLLGG